MKSKTAAQSSSVLPLLTLVCRALDDKKAGDVRVLNVAAQSSITDYLVVATGTSEPHLRALRVELEKVIDAAKAPILSMNSEQGSGWMVIDAFDMMIHVFTPENREKYAIENLWKDAEEISVPELIAEPKAVKVAKKAVAKKPRATAVKKTAATKSPAKKSAAKRKKA